MGIEVTDGTLRYLELAHKKKESNHHLKASFKCKQKRAVKTANKIAEQVAAANKKRDKQGYYRPGELDNSIPLAPTDPSDEDGNKKKRAKKNCPHCGKAGHVTTRGKHCLRHEKPNTGASVVE